MEAMMKQFKDLQVIPFEEIRKATNTFHNDNYLGGGGFGMVYKGELSRFKERGLVAFKRLDRQYGQGETEFLKEISMLSLYKHENLITLLGYCIEQKEMILVYEHAAHGSLDFHLGSRDLTWTQRLKICLQAAEGLRYLHDPNGAHHMVIHRDIKSGNILLDDKWNAKVADVGLSKISPENANLVTVVRGTPGYTDPEYHETYTLTGQSDVYSFGVTLFEVLCGSLCYEIIDENKVRVFVRKWKESYQTNKLEEIIFKELDIKQIDPSSIKLFSDIAYQCLNKSGKERPTMAEVVSKLKAALQTQEEFDMAKKHPLVRKYIEILRAAVSPLSYSSIEELKGRLSKGILINGGKAWLSINEKGQHIERIYIEACLNPAEIAEDCLQHPYGDIVNSRFPEGRCYKYRSEFKACARGEYLTPQISYRVNLVFRYSFQDDVNRYNPLRYKVDGEDETKVFIIYPTDMRQDGWFIAPLHQFISQHKSADLQFIFEVSWRELLVAGIEFQPSEEKVEHQVFEEYQYLIKAASQSLVYRSLQEVKQILSKGIYVKDYKTWFSLNKEEEHCEMISMEDCLIPNEDFTPRYESHYWSRFPAGFYQTNNKGFETHVKTQFLSPSITYTVNLVFFAFSISKRHHVDLTYRLRGETTTSTVYIANRREVDGLYMAELCQFTSHGSIVECDIIFDNHASNLQVEGILFQPLEKVEDPILEDDKLSIMIENLVSGLGKCGLFGSGLILMKMRRNV
nr:protein kinase-like domain, phloem protein 2-like protein [Tanacetum cinerariifolium]